MLPVLYNNNYQIVQTPENIVILVEMVHDARIVRINGTHAPPTVKQWFGDSIGKWEGDTLVVDVTGLNGKAWLDRAGDFSSDGLHVVERYTLMDHDHIAYEATLEDPKVYTRPWTMKFPIRAQAGQDIMEFECLEGERDLQHYVK